MIITCDFIETCKNMFQISRISIVKLFFIASFFFYSKILVWILNTWLLCEVKKDFSASYKASVGTGISYMVFFFLLKLYFILSLFVFTLSALQQPKTYIYVLLLLCMRPKYFHTSNQGCIYTSLIYFTSSQERKYRSSSSDFL